MKKKAIALGVAGILIYSVPIMPVKAISNTYEQSVSTDNQTRTAGLILNMSLSIASGNKKIYLTGKTLSNNSMKSIGFKDISIEYSSDNVHWDEEKTIDDLLESDSSNYYLNDYAVPVKGGYYYRVKLTHYAKEKGLFGSSQSVNNTSNSVWVS